MLRRQGDAELGNCMGFHALDFRVLEQYAPLARHHDADYALQGCRFTGPISAKQANDFTAIDLNRHPVKNMALVVEAMDALYLEHHPSLPR